MPKSLPKAGLRISKPQRITFLPNRENDMAKLAATKVLPSPDIEEVNKMTCSFSFIMNCTFVRNERNISSIWLFLSACTTIPADDFTLSLATGMSATMGSIVMRATSSCPSIRKRSSCNSHRMAKGTAKPTTKAASSIMAFLGLTLPLNCGSSIILPLLAVAASEILFSSRFCKSSK